MKKLISLLLVLAMIAALLPMTMAEPAVELDYETVELTDGDIFADDLYVAFFTVADAEGNEVKTMILTAQETVGAALVELNLVGGSETDWGLYVDTINGITADYNEDQSWWEFFVNGESSLTGVDATAMESGADYAFRLNGGSKTFADAAEPEEGDPVLLEDGGVYYPAEWKLFTLVVEDGVNEAVQVLVFTNKATVGEALLALGIIDGDDSDWGLYVKEINGVVADYSVDGHYWAFYIDGEYAMTGVDATEITEGAVYSFKVE